MLFFFFFTVCSHESSRFESRFPLSSKIQFRSGVRDKAGHDGNESWL